MAVGNSSVLRGGLTNLAKIQIRQRGRRGRRRRGRRPDPYGIWVRGGLTQCKIFGPSRRVHPRSHALPRGFDRAISL